jgi:hypothetical protein
MDKDNDKLYFFDIDSTRPTSSLQFNANPSFESSGQGRNHIPSYYQQGIRPHSSGMIEGQQEYVNRIEAPTSSVSAGFGGTSGTPFMSSNALQPAMLPPTSTHRHNTDFGLQRNVVQPATQSISNTGDPIRKTSSVIWNLYNVVKEGRCLFFSFFDYMNALFQFTYSQFNNAYYLISLFLLANFQVMRSKQSVNTAKKN